MKKTIGLYPGSFDPITNGHLDIIFRASKVVDTLIIGVAINEKKKHLFDMTERTNLINEQLEINKIKLSNTKVIAFDGLLMNFAQKLDANIIIRGLRAVSDFDYEFQMTGMNARLDSNIETVFLMASEKHQFISSRFVKEIAQLGGNLNKFTTKSIISALKKKYENSF